MTRHSEASRNTSIHNQKNPSLTACCSSLLACAHSHWCFLIVSSVACFFLYRVYLTSTAPSVLLQPLSGNPSLSPDSCMQDFLADGQVHRRGVCEVFEKEMLLLDTLSSPGREEFFVFNFRRESILKYSTVVMHVIIKVFCVIRWYS